MKRHLLFTTTLLALSATLLHAAQIGDGIRTTKAETKIRTEPAAGTPHISAETLLGTQGNGSTGVIMAGPITTEEFSGPVVWWQVDFLEGVDGWCGEDNLAVIVVETPPATGARTLTLSWQDNSTNEQGFVIERAPGTADAAASTWVTLTQVGADTTGYIDAGLPDAATFSYRVYAYNAVGRSGTTNIGTGTTRGGGTVPTDPSGMGVEPEAGYEPPVSVTLQPGQSLRVTAAATAE